MEWGLFGTKTKATMIWRGWHWREVLFDFIRTTFPPQFFYFFACESVQVEARDGASALDLFSIHLPFVWHWDLLVSAVRNQCYRFLCFYFYFFILSLTRLLIETVPSLSLRPGSVFNDCACCSNTHAGNFHLCSFASPPVDPEYVLSRGALWSSGR